MVRTDSMNPIGDATIVMLQGINGDKVLRNSRTIGGGPGHDDPHRASRRRQRRRRRRRCATPRAEFARFALACSCSAPQAMPLEFTYGGEAEADEGKADVIDAKGRRQLRRPTLPRQEARIVR